MAHNIFLGSVVLCLLSIGLSQVSDPTVLGIHEEPARIMFYGGSGLLAGLFGLTALASGIYRFAGVSEGKRRVMLAIMLIVLIAVLTAFVIRFYPV